MTLYTNHSCPYAHRAHIALKELGLSCDEVFIDLEKPREPWYLEVNPRGLVPSLVLHNSPLATPPHDTVTLTESAIVAQFLADLYPSHLLPASNSPEGALRRARIAFFTDTYDSKVAPFLWKSLLADSEADKEARCVEWAAALKKEIEPLLSDAKPFFGGSEKITMAEVIIAPFILRADAYVRHGLLPASLGKELDSLPNFSRWAQAITKAESVLEIWEEDITMKQSKSKLAQMQEKKAKEALLKRVGGT
ncbi:thioredoxin-like protein [Rhizodiscina lignyota]|uniref:Thioredoxin-like protein n=1 Tax=Rhizodiscina lignyota TaxID=1504668 RepID=A0A9P4IHF9_9PEZI|nr:thioredoxin-like protein [Rhizodiscina lignyota]